MSRESLIAYLEKHGGLIVSGGTLRTEDLATALVGVAYDLGLTKVEATLEAAIANAYEHIRDDDETIYDEDGALSEAVAEAEDAINAALPSKWWYGSTEGDGACFGIWSADQEE